MDSQENVKYPQDGLQSDGRYVYACWEKVFGDKIMYGVTKPIELPSDGKRYWCDIKPVNSSNPGAPKFRLIFKAANDDNRGEKSYQASQPYPQQGNKEHNLF